MRKDRGQQSQMCDDDVLDSIWQARTHALKAVAPKVLPTANWKFEGKRIQCADSERKEEERVSTHRRLFVLSKESIAHLPLSREELSSSTHTKAHRDHNIGSLDASNSSVVLKREKEEDRLVDRREDQNKEDAHEPKKEQRS